MVSVEYSEAIVEVLDILYNSEDNIIEKIPKELIEFWQRNKSTTYKIDLDHSKLINEMNLKKKTKAIITMIYLNYLCDDIEKSNIKLIIENNDKKYQQELKERYNADNIFKSKMKEETHITEMHQELIEYKPKSFINKMFNKIKKLFI